MGRGRRERREREKEKKGRKEGNAGWARYVVTNSEITPGGRDRKIMN